VHRVSLYADGLQTRFVIYTNKLIKRNKAMKSLFGSMIFLVVGVVLLAIAAPLYFTEQAFLTHSIMATGTVVDFRVDETEDPPSYCPIVEFSTQDGRTVRFNTEVCTSPSSKKIGDPVEVIYDPRNPKSVQTASFWGEYIWPLALGLVGLPFLIIGLLGLIAIKLKPTG
jgi:hypothetical protein